MTTVATRGVSLVVKAPTLEDVIRWTSNQTGSGATVSFTLPPDVQDGDILNGWIAAPDPEAYDTSYSGQISYFYRYHFPYEDASFNAPNTTPGIAYFEYGGILSASDANGVVSISLGNYTGEYSGSLASCTCVIKKRETTDIGDLDAEGDRAYGVLDWGYYALASNYESGLDGPYNYTTQPYPKSQAYSPKMIIEGDYQLVFFVCAASDLVTTTPLIGETELCDLSVSSPYSASLYVGCKLFNMSSGAFTPRHFFNQSAPVYFIGATIYVPR
jgi:hypothetical protein